MKKLLQMLFAIAIFSGVAISFSSCKDEEDEIKHEYESLFAKTDKFIDWLDVIYSSYDMLGKKAEDSSDGKYTVTPIGRMIVVKKKSYVSNSYNDICSALKTHYKNKPKVNEVYINNGGTITIDCRK